MRDEDDEGNAGGDTTQQRVDRWMWFARVIKSRTLAAGLVTEGRVRLNKVKVEKPSQLVRVGDVLTITIGPRLRILQVAGIGQRRGPATEAQQLYQDLTPPPPPREDQPLVVTSGEREAGSGRPTKRDRRLLDKLQGE